MRLVQQQTMIVGGTFSNREQFLLDYFLAPHFTVEERNWVFLFLFSKQHKILENDLTGLFLNREET